MRPCKSAITASESFGTCMDTLVRDAVAQACALQVRRHGVDLSLPTQFRAAAPRVDCSFLQIFSDMRRCAVASGFIHSRETGYD